MRPFSSNFFAGQRVGSGVYGMKDGWLHAGSGCNDLYSVFVVWWRETQGMQV